MKSLLLASSTTHANPSRRLSPVMALQGRMCAVCVRIWERLSAWTRQLEKHNGWENVRRQMARSVVEIEVKRC